jgi:hypothetical protein
MLVKKMKVLFIYNLYYENNKDIVDHKDKLRTSFEAAFEQNKEHSYEVVHLGYEENDIKNSEQLNRTLLEKEFDIAVVSEEDHWIVYLETAKKLGKKLFLCHWDTWLAMSSNLEVNFRITSKKPRAWGNFQQTLSLAQLAEYCNILVFDYGYNEILPNMYGVATPIDTRIFYKDPNIVQDLEVCHNGMMYIPERIDYATMFDKAKVNITYTGSMNKNIYPAQMLTLNEYANIFQRSKISLCFTDSVFGPLNKQRKGKIYEIAASGSFLLTTNPEVIDSRKSAWFKQGVHFDSMNLGDCVDKVRFYMKNPDVAKNMANAMHEHYLQIDGPINWWKNIFTFRNL